MHVDKAAHPRVRAFLCTVTLSLLVAIPALPAQSQDFSCPKPLAIPDAWDDLNGNGEYDENEPYDPLVTGYGPDDVGQTLTLSFSDAAGTSRFGAMFAVDFPAINRGDPLTGSDAFREWLVECSPFELAVDDTLLMEPGPHADTTLAAFLGFINQDPEAYWDEETQTVQGSQFSQSPRIVTLLAYDPEVFPLELVVVKLAKFLSLFVESIGPGSRINGRILDAGSGGPAPIFPSTWGSLKNRY